jgi:hypothetical protein
MAKIKLSAILSDARGKLQNIVFTPGRSCLAIRTRVSPFNPQTAFQTSVRAFFAVWSASWRALDQLKIAAWNSFTTAAQKSNVFGDKYHTTGHKLYVAYNTFNSLFGDGVEIDTPFIPVIPATIGVSAIDPDATLGHFTVTIDDPVPANTKLIISATFQQSAGVSNFKGKFVDIMTFPAGTAAGDLDVMADYELHCGDLVTGNKLAVQCYLTNVHATKHVVKFKAGAELAGKVR